MMIYNVIEEINENLIQCIKMYKKTIAGP